MIAFKNITIQLHGHNLLTDTDLQINPGDKVVIRGPSGCGKSSLLKAAVGALPLAAGTVQIDGMQLSAATVADIRARIAFIGQEPVLGADRVLEALLLPFRFKAHRGNDATGKQIAELLERLHLSTDILDTPCARISGGEKQRIAIARALLLGKNVFLADEVTSALDPESRTAVMDELFRPELTLLSVAHDSEWVRRCDRVIEIRNTQLIESGADQQIGNQKSAIKHASTGGGE